MLKYILLSPTVRPILVELGLLGVLLLSVCLCAAVVGHVSDLHRVVLGPPTTFGDVIVSAIRFIFVATLPLLLTVVILAVMIKARARGRLLRLVGFALVVISVVVGLETMGPQEYASQAGFYWMSVNWPGNTSELPLRATRIIHAEQAVVLVVRAGVRGRFGDPVGKGLSKSWATLQFGNPSFEVHRQGASRQRLRLDQPAEWVFSLASKEKRLGRQEMASRS